MKKLLTALFFIILAIFGWFYWMTATMTTYWGHHFSFENELGIDIDSLEITVGNIKTMIVDDSDSSEVLEGNIDVPETGYPHAVVIEVYHKGESIILQADPFNCYNCDGSHQYTLLSSGARYEFLN